MNFVDFGSPSSLSELDKKVEELDGDDFPLVFKVGNTKFSVETSEQMNSYYSVFRTMYKNIEEG